MDFGVIGVDIVYLMLYATEPLLILAMGGFLCLCFLQGIAEAIQIIRR